MYLIFENSRNCFKNAIKECSYLTIANLIVTSLQDTTEFLNENSLISSKSAISPIANAPSRAMRDYYVSSKWNLQLSTSGRIPGIKVPDTRQDPLVCPVQPRKTARKMLVVTSLIKEWTDEVGMERHAVERCY